MKRKLRTFLKNVNKKERVLVTLLFAVVLSGMTIGYAAFQSNLKIIAEINLKAGDIEIESVSVSKTKNATLVGEIETDKQSTDNNKIANSKMTINMPGPDDNNYISIKYQITNNTKDNFTFKNYNQNLTKVSGGNPQDYRSPKLYGITPGDVLAPGDSITVTLTYMGSDSIESTVFEAESEFVFTKDTSSVVIPTLDMSLDNTRLSLGDDNMTDTVLTILNGYSTTNKITLSIDTDKYVLTKDTGRESEYPLTLLPGETKKQKIYFKLKDTTITNEETKFKLYATLEDGSKKFLVGTITIGRQVIDDLPKFKVTVNEEKTEKYPWGPYYSLYLDVENNYETDINDWTIHVDINADTGITKVASNDNSVALAGNRIIITSKKPYDNEYITVPSGGKILVGQIYIEYTEDKPFRIDNIEVIAKTQPITPSIGSEYKEAALNGAIPVYPSMDDNNFLPVEIDAKGKVTVADITTEWYNYSKGKWANAVVLRTEGRKDWWYGVGEEIDHDDILHHVVWIPRYKYELFNVAVDGTKVPVQSINVVFESKSKSPSYGSNNGEYLTHPAFTEYNTNGFWIGKFEISGIESNNRKSLPYQEALTKLSVSEFYDMMLGINPKYNTHMINALEWGAVMYLTHSKYGIGTNEVQLNGNSGLLTGCGSVNNQETTECPYAYATTEGNYPQSTTGNISGIFDLAGGAFEYIAATTNQTVTGKYYTKYAGITASDRILGDAFQETANWFDDGRSFFNSTEQYIARGGSYKNGKLAGLEYYWHTNGAGYSTHSSRIIFNP